MTGGVLVALDPGSPDRDDAVRIAADLIELLAFPSTSSDPGRDHSPLPRPAAIAVLGDPAACLEIGLALFGWGRPAEGEPSEPSPLVLMPFATRREFRRKLARGLVAGENDQRYGTLDELLWSGAVREVESLRVFSRFDKALRSTLPLVKERFGLKQVIVFDKPEDRLQTATRELGLVLVHAPPPELKEAEPFLSGLEDFPGRLRETQQAEVRNAIRLETLFRSVVASPRADGRD